MKKCTIITLGPGTRDIIHDEAIVVPPGDPEALAQAIRTAWHDDALRQRIAAKGRDYVEKLGGTAAFYDRILAICARVANLPPPESTTL